MLTLLPLQASGAAGLLLLSGCCLSPGDARAPELKLAVGLAAAAVVSGVAADEEGCDGGAPGLAAPAAADDDAGAGKRSGPAGDAARAPEARKKFASSGCVVGAGGGVEAACWRWAALGQERGPPPHCPLRPSPAAGHEAGVLHAVIN
eukprot:1158283-Pelagomonas_calceolata.AAC.4